MFFSQDGQDEFVETHIFKGFKNGFFVDVGAHDGIAISNTLFFEKYRDWKGINIEPNPEVYLKLQQNRPLCANINCAVSIVEGEDDFVCNKGYTEMLSGLKKNYDPRHIERICRENLETDATSKLIKVKTLTLKTIFKINNITRVHYLSIDVEGAEFDVIKSIDFDNVFIDVIDFENNYHDKSIPIVEYLQEKGYMIMHTLLSFDIIMIHKNSPFASS